MADTQGQLIALPRGGGAIQGIGEKFAPDPLGGAAHRLGGYPSTHRYSAATAATNHAVRRCTTCAEWPVPEDLL